MPLGLTADFSSTAVDADREVTLDHVRGVTTTQLSAQLGGQWKRRMSYGHLQTFLDEESLPPAPSLRVSLKHARQQKEG